MQVLLILNLIVPFVMMLVSYILKKHPVSDMRAQNGYNTSVARKSQDHWDYAQSIAPDIYLSLGKTLLIIEVVLSIMLLLLDYKVTISIAIGMCIGFGFLFLGFYITDSKILEKFQEN